ncbi:MAG: 2,3-epoxybenzoyl-CoA dihydrolase [Myxococcota bacterium]
MPISFETHPDRYRHWKLSIEGDVARLTMGVELRGGLSDEYELKLNSYDLSVDIELADSIQRLRFTHPEVKVVVLDSSLDRVFCAGANIPMLGSSTHAFKVNFCKFTNETRLYLEDASKHSGLRFLAALNGTCAGGGYELAMASDDILLIDDGSSAVSLPEVPLLGVLPGTGGLTRLVDKRAVRRDRADVFCTTSEGIRGKRAVEWGLVDAIAPRSKFTEVVAERVDELRGQVAEVKKGPGIELPPLEPTVEGDSWTYRYVSLAVKQEERVAELTIRAPENDEPTSADAIQAAGAEQWALRAFRELDDALLRLRFNHLQVGLIVVRTEGDSDAVAAVSNTLVAQRDHWLVREIVAFQARVLRRLDVSSRSIFALIDEGSCFVGPLLEIALAADRVYMLEDDDEKVALRLTELNRAAYPTGSGLSRLESRFFYDAPALAAALERIGAPLAAQEASNLGLVTVAADDIDWEDDVRIAIEERVSLSPDSLTGMEASLRYPGPETMETKIFARLSAWQNWIFQRPNAVGPQGALTKYGEPDRPVFDWTRC